MKKKLMCVVLSLAMIMSLGLTAFAVEYGDVPANDPAAAAINRWSGYQIVNGMGDGTFNPGGDMTRAQAAQVMAKLFKLSDKTGAKTFPDVASDAWYAEAVALVTAANIMSGDEHGNLNPNTPINRQEFFVMFARGLDLKEKASTSGATSDGAAWAEGYINALTDKGYVRGNLNGDVNAVATIARREVMMLMNQTIDVYANEYGETYTGTGKNIALVVANNVTLTGEFDDVIVKNSNEVTLKDAKVKGTLSVDSAAKVTMDGSTTVATLECNNAGATFATVGNNVKVTATVPADLKIEGQTTTTTGSGTSSGSTGSSGGSSSSGGSTSGGSTSGGNASDAPSNPRPVPVTPDVTPEKVESAVEGMLEDANSVIESDANTVEGVEGKAIESVEVNEDYQEKVTAAIAVADATEEEVEAEPIVFTVTLSDELKESEVKITPNQLLAILFGGNAEVQEDVALSADSVVTPKMVAKAKEICGGADKVSICTGAVITGENEFTKGPNFRVVAPSENVPAKNAADTVWTPRVERAVSIITGIIGNQAVGALELIANVEAAGIVVLVQFDNLTLPYCFTLK